MTYEEFERVKEVESKRISNPLFAWNTDFEIVVTANISERQNFGTSVARLNGRMDFIGNREMFRPLNEIPPEGLRIACNNIWREMKESGIFDVKIPENIREGKSISDT